MDVDFVGGPLCSKSFDRALVTLTSNSRSKGHLQELYCSHGNLRTICTMTLILHMEMVLYDSLVQNRLGTLTSFPRSQGHLIS